MNRTWFTTELETVATFWRVLRNDGVTLGFTSHDTDMWFDGILHRASPGMVPSSIKRSADFDPDSAEVEGALSHESISASDLSAGRFDTAQVRIGVVDWETGEAEILYRGAIGSVLEQDGGFSAELISRKAEFLRDPIPRTSPSCRAAFCGSGCDLPAIKHTHEGVLASINPEMNSVTVATDIPLLDLVGGWIRWLDGPQASMHMNITAVSGTELVLGVPLDAAIQPGARAMLREGCDHTLDTCATRFSNAANFRGEPYLPGNDLLARYPTPGQ